MQLQDAARILCACRAYPPTDSKTSILRDRFLCIVHWSATFSHRAILPTYCTKSSESIKISNLLLFLSSSRNAVSGYEHTHTWKIILNGAPVFVPAHSGSVDQVFICLASLPKHKKYPFINKGVRNEIKLIFLQQESSCALAASTVCYFFFTFFPHFLYSGCNKFSNAS